MKNKILKNFSERMKADIHGTKGDSWEDNVKEDRPKTKLPKYSQYPKLGVQ